MLHMFKFPISRYSEPIGT